MRAEIRYLWQHREKPTTLKRALILIAKRLLNVYPLLRILWRIQRFRSKGATIGTLCVLGEISYSASLKNLVVGDHCSVGSCELFLHDTIQIGNFVTINGGVKLISASHRLTDPLWRHKKSPIHIGDYAWIATNSIILPGVRIGRGAVVGAGAVVREDVPDYGIVTGNPATLETHRRTSDLHYYPALFNAPFEAWIGKNLVRS